MTGGLTLAGITRRFTPDQPAALAEVDLHVPPGSCTALLGPSGSGKTTLLRAAAGLDPVDAGSVHLDGRDLARVAPERRSMAMVFQRPLLFPHLTVRDNVAFPGRATGLSRREARDEAMRFLHLVGLPQLADRDVRALSGGQQQRVALARALAARPKALLLDEPFAALDPTLRAEMHELLLELRAVLEPTVLLVTHDHEEASALADDVAVLIAGRLVQNDPVDIVYRRPAGVEVHRLLGGVNELPGPGRPWRAPLAAHFDSLMRGRHGLPRPRSEVELARYRQRFVDMFQRLRADHGVPSYLAHNMTVTPANLGQVAETVRATVPMGFDMLSFQPAAFVGDDRRWRENYREVTPDAVWAEVERGMGTRLPWRALQMGDPRCNRTAWGWLVDGRFVPGPGRH